MTYYYYIILGLGLFIALNVYFRISERYQLIDIPNHRSSHDSITIRGGGIVIPLGVISFLLINGVEYPYLFTGLVIVSIISFFDDLGHLPPMVRISGQILAMGLLFHEIIGNQFLSPVILVLFVIAIGVPNAYNFMDGINGIMVSYSLILITTLTYLNISIISFVDPGLLWTLIIGLLVLGFYNFRTNAKCFAGDVGSISLAFLVVFLIGLLIHETGTGIWILLLAIFGTDSVLTIADRIRKKENIFKAHRSHLYQYYANIEKVGHLKISTIYALLQLVINIALILNFKYQFLNDWILATLILAPLAGFYLYRKNLFEEKLKLTTN